VLSTYTLGDIPGFVDNYPLFAEVVSVVMKSKSFYTTAPARWKWGHTQVPTLFRAYPDNARKCSMIAPISTFNTPASL
jgi:hypothetical protein